jgi:hypothetical protein
MKLKSVVLLSIIGFVISFASNAAGPKVYGTPKQYFYAPDGSVLKESKDVEEKIFWVVFSDRSDNSTFETASAKKIKKVMQYLEKFYVTDESGDYLHLFKYADNVFEKDNGRRLNKNAVDYGWAPKQNLLLWVKCIVNEKRIPIRALPIITLPFIQQDLMPYMNFEESKMKLYKKPSLPADSFVTSADMYQFLYVYKDEGNSVLLAKKSLTNAFSIETDVVGWASKKVLQLWGGNYFLEPVWGSAAYEERSKKGISCSVFSNKYDALYWQRSGVSVAPLWNDDPGEKPWSPEIKRFPLLSQDSTVCKIGLIVKFAYSTSTKAQEKGAGKTSKGQVSNSFSILLPGYTALSTDNLNTPSFRKVIFLSSEELAEITNQIKLLLIESLGPALRTNFSTGLAAILATHVGSDKAEEMIKKEKMTPADIVSFITGVPCRNTKLSNCFVADIAKPEKVMDSDLILMQRYLLGKYQALSSVVGQNELALRLSWDTFYWVPDDLMP